MGVIEYTEMRVVLSNML